MYETQRDASAAMIDFLDDREGNENLKRSILAALILLLALIWVPMPLTGKTIQADANEPVDVPRRHVFTPKPIEVAHTKTREAGLRIPIPEDLVPDIPSPKVSIPTDMPTVPDITETEITDWGPHTTPDLPQNIGTVSQETVGLVLPKITKRVQPNYPRFAKRLGVEGSVIIEAVMHKDGSVRDIRVLHGVKEGKFGFEKEAMAALKQWRFEPGDLEGRTVSVRMTLTIEFKMK